MAAHRAAVANGLRALRRVEDEGDVAVLQEVHDVRSAFSHFVNVLCFDPRALEHFAGPLGRDDVETQVLQPTREIGRGRFVVLLHADEDLPLVGKLQVR